MIDAFGVRKDWWEEPPPKEKHVFSTGEKVAAGTAAGLGVGAGAVYLATRGKGSGAVKTITRTVKAKPKVKTKVKTKIVKVPGPTRTVVIKEPAPPAPPAAAPKTLYVTPEQVARQRARGKAQMDKVDLEQSQLRLRRKQAPAEAEKPPLTADGEPAALPTDEDAVTPEQAKRQARRAAARLHGKPSKRVKKSDEGVLAKRLALDVFDEIMKADVTLTGEPGDKRNTKYAAAGGAGYLVGANVGSHLGARAAGTTYAKNRKKVHEAVQAHNAEAKIKQQKKVDAYDAKYKKEARRSRNPLARKVVYYDPKNPPAKKAWGYKYLPQDKKPPNRPIEPRFYQPSVKTLARVHNSVKGTKAIVGGGAAGSVLGVGGGLGAVALYRRDKRKKLQAAMNPEPIAQETVAKVDDPRQKITPASGAVLGGIAGAASGNAVAIPAARMAAKMGKKSKAGKNFTRSLIRFNKSPIVLAPIGLGIGLGAIGGKGAKDMRAKEVSKGETPEMMAVLAKREEMARL